MGTGLLSPPTPRHIVCVLVISLVPYCFLCWPLLIRCHLQRAPSLYTVPGAPISIRLSLRANHWQPHSFWIQPLVLASPFLAAALPRRSVESLPCHRHYSFGNTYSLLCISVHVPAALSCDKTSHTSLLRLALLCGRVSRPGQAIRALPLGPIPFCLFPSCRESLQPLVGPKPGPYPKAFCSGFAF